MIHGLFEFKFSTEPRGGPLDRIARLRSGYYASLALNDGISPGVRQRAPVAVKVVGAARGHPAGHVYVPNLIEKNYETHFVDLYGFYGMKPYRGIRLRAPDGSVEVASKRDGPSARPRGTAVTGLARIASWRLRV